MKLAEINKIYLFFLIRGGPNVIVGVTNLFKIKIEN
jgi:hypothetical protein